MYCSKGNEMNNQQRAAMIRPRGKSEAPHMIAAYRAMQMALETAEEIVKADWKTWEELASPKEFVRWAKSRANHMATALREALENNELSDVTLINEGDMAQPQDHSEQHLNMVQGKWVDLTSKEINEVWCRGINYEAAINAVIAKFKEKNTPPVVPDGYALIGIDALKAWGKYEEVSNACCHPIHKPVVPQGEPVAIVHNTDTPGNWSIIKPGLPAGTPLYTTPPPVESIVIDSLLCAFSIVLASPSREHALDALEQRMKEVRKPTEKDCGGAQHAQ